MACRSQFGPRFLLNPEWNPWTGEFGALSLIYGTLVSSLIAVSLALPFSLGVALFLNEMAPHGNKAGRGVEMLAAIPSLVYGWGLLFWLHSCGRALSLFWPRLLVCHSSKAPPLDWACCALEESWR